MDLFISSPTRSPGEIQSRRLSAYVGKVDEAYDIIDVSKDDGIAMTQENENYFLFYLWMPPDLVFCTTTNNWYVLCEFWLFVDIRIPRRV